MGNRPDVYQYRRLVWNASANQNLMASMLEPMSEPDAATTLSGQTMGAFVGRQQEMGRLTEVLNDALAGQGRLLMLVGEPGIGKTYTRRSAPPTGWRRLYMPPGTV